MRFVLGFIFFLLALPAIAQVRKEKVFSFKEVTLFTKLSEFPESYKHDCSNVESSTFCSIKTSFGGVNADVDFYFDEGHLINIDVYFDPSHVEVMSRAMLKKLGPAAISHKGTLMWYATDEKPYLVNFSDKVVFSPEAKRLPMVAMVATSTPNQYAVISYRSLELVRRQTAKDIKDLDSKAKAAADEL